MKNQCLFFALWVISMLVELPAAHAFCGFYVAKADASLFNNRSEVILVRDGQFTTITMSSDFKGNVRDFAMVVPVPVVLREADIRVVNRNVFQFLDNYSSPRLVEYYDQNPCYPVIDEAEFLAKPSAMATNKSIMEDAVSADYGVKIEARYQVGEYDILILSATESNGLKQWLLMNEYKIPAGAEEVLDPYIRSNMKFFVVKVNLDKLLQRGTDYLSPLQISFTHEKFMLPIRLGMANANGDQDMIVYGFSKRGRLECTNYRTVKMPTDRNIPLFAQRQFGDIYRWIFDKSYRNEGRNALFIEYAWDVTPNWGMKCDPCVGPPPMQQEFADAGVHWHTTGESIFFTRLHVRYSRSKFPSDLVFQETPNREHFQARYVITHPAQGDLSCDEGQDYILRLQEKRQLEVDELQALTGRSFPAGLNYIYELKTKAQVSERRNEVPTPFALPSEPETPHSPESPPLPVADSPSFPLRELFTMLLFLLLCWIGYAQAVKRIKYRPGIRT
jgi:hypothetical protein